MDRKEKIEALNVRVSEVVFGGFGQEPVDMKMGEIESIRMRSLLSIDGSFKVVLYLFEDETSNHPSGLLDCMEPIFIKPGCKGVVIKFINDSEVRLKVHGIDAMECQLIVKRKETIGVAA